MRRFLPLLTLTVLLAACVDTTGLSATSSRKPTGNPESAITVTEFGDLQCPACKSAHDSVNQPVLEKYGKDISFVFKHFPLSSLHPYALEAAQASECAADQGKFWEFFDMDYKNQADLSSSALRDWAKELKLDTDLFDRCLRSGIKKKTVMADYAEGVKLGVSGTPTYFVNGQKVESSPEAIGAAIEQAKNAGNMPL